MAKTISNEQLTLAAKTISMLAVDGVEQANSGHPGMPMGMAECAAVLFLKHLRFNPNNPNWLNRDRFVLSNGHGSMLQYALLHLAGYEVSLEDLKSFRQWGSNTPGHPESFMTPGVECTTGPLGQGLANAVGMAIAERLLAERYNQQDIELFSHRIYCFAGDGCLMEGVASEASSIAGHLGLGNLTVIYDDNHISIAGNTALAFTEDACKRYEAYGWHVQAIDGHDLTAIDNAIQTAVGVKDKPSLIAARTTIGKGSPNKANSHGVHGSPLGADERKLTRSALGWPDESFHVPSEVRSLFAERVEHLGSVYNQWQELFAKFEQKHADKASALKAQTNREIPHDLLSKMLEAVSGNQKPAATRKLSETVLQIASREVNSLIGGSADLEPSTLTLIKDSTDIQRQSFSGKNLRFGVREHAMGSIMNGLAHTNCFIPYGSTFLTFSDYMRPTIRLAALSHLPGLFIFTHDSIFLGEDGPTHQPVEHLNSLRIVPNVYVLRPADAVETAVCYDIALRRHDGPSILSLTRQNIPQLERPADFEIEQVKKGAYVVYQTSDNPTLVFVATGSEVSLAVDAAKAVSDKAVRVVSMPCYERFAEQSETYRQSIIPRSARKVTIEAGVTKGWMEMVQGSPEDTICIGLDRFGASAPYEVLAEKFGFTANSVVSKLAKFNVAG